MRNQYIAKVLFSNRLATNEQIKKYWPQITQAKDIGVILVEAGLLKPAMYKQVLEYVKKLELKKSKDSSTNTESNKISDSKTSNTFSRASVAVKPTPTKESLGVSKKETLNPVTANTIIKNTAKTELQIEGNNPYADTSGTPPIQVEAVAGLESTNIARVQLKREETDDLTKEKQSLPDQFAINSGLGDLEIEVPRVIDPSMSLLQILSYARQFYSTVVYLHLDSPIAVYQSGSLHYVSETKIDSNQLMQWLSEASRGFVDSKEFTMGRNFSKTFALKGAGRARLSVTWLGVTPYLAIRLIPLQSIALEDLNLPAFCKDFLSLESGLVIIAGEASSGRSTTMATFAETIASQKGVYIQTIEKPIERLLQNPNGIIAQKEIGLHASTGAQATRTAINDGADLILFDHIENIEELGLLLQAANAGVLVFAVTSGKNILGILTRFLDSVSEMQRQPLAQSLAEQLKGVIVQHLKHIVDKQGEVLAEEALKVSTTIASLIRKMEFMQIPSTLASMKSTAQTLDDSLQNLVDLGYIEGSEAWKRAFDVRRFMAYKPSKKVEI